MRDRKGFTLIELLAVIVILALLMAVAIPSVTKYIETSRKEIVVDTIGGYISSITVEVNNRDYQFSTPNTIYAVPLECIELERGGDNPFGEWLQANDNYWAYVLIEYDSDNFSYNYGFTFKDSAGYGLYPTLQDNISKTDINVGYDDLSKPESGDAINFISADKWDGFNITSTTQLVVLEAESEGVKGDGKETCALCQKGSNYAQVEEEKKNNAYAIYSEDDDSFTFVRSTTEIKDGDVYNGKTVTNVYTGFENTNYNVDNLPPWFNYDEENFVNVKNVIVEDNIQPLSTAYWFAWFYNCSNMNLTNLDVSRVTNMEGMFQSAGEEVTTFNVIGLDYWNTSNVTNMKNIFAGAGEGATTLNIVGLSNWDTSNVINMEGVFHGTGNNATTWSIGDLSNWDTSKVTNMKDMFQAAGNSSPNWSVGSLKNWDVSNVTDMSYMFDNVGWETKNISIDLSNWDVSNVTDMSSMFSGFGRNATTVNIIGLSNWDVSNVTDMSSMFSGFGRNATTVNTIGLSNWDTSKVTNMANMFLDAGTTATTFNIGDLSEWDTQNVTTMGRMFENAGKNAMWSLDCSNWNVDKVTYKIWFNKNVEAKVTAPTWK